MVIVIKYLKNGKKFTSNKLINDDYLIKLEEDGNRVKVVIIPKERIVLLSANVFYKQSYTKDDLIYENGYQSWTDSKEMEIDEKLKGLSIPCKMLDKRFGFSFYGDYTFTKYESKAIHSYTYSYIKNKKTQDGLLIGSYNEKNAYLLIKHYPKESILRLSCDINNIEISDEFKLFDYVLIKGNIIKVQEEYFSKYQNRKVDRLSGFTSWYNYYQNINEQIILDGLKAMDSKHYNLYQIDDGYETFVGDWLNVDKNKFPNGLKDIVDKVHEKGLKAGIWLAPFVVEKKSETFRKHPDWVARNKKGKMVYAGGNWSGFYALDIEKKEVQEYIKICLEKYMDLGFDFFKLDFLYAAALKYSTKETRAQIMSNGMHLLRNILKDKLILGCGVPLGSAFELVDYCRIGCDVSLNYLGDWYMRMLHREKVSTQATLVNTIYRSSMNEHVFYNDPDVFLLRDDNLNMTNEQKRTVVTLNHLCGSVYLTSDMIKDYDKEKLDMLEESKDLIDTKITFINREKNNIRIKFIKDYKEKEIIFDVKKGTIEYVR